MKKTTRTYAAAVLALVSVACNKAEFHDADIVTFAFDKVNITEDAGTLKIPVLLYGADETVVTYSVTANTAKEGEHYEIVDRDGNPNKTGVLTVSNVDKAVNDSIRIKIHDFTGIETGNLTFTVTLGQAAEENLHLGAFNSCLCKIVDIDSGLVKLLGSWEGDGVDDKGSPVSFAFDLEDYDPSQDEEAEYPEANCMLTNGNLDNGDMTFKWPIYGYYDQDMSQLHIYAHQPFNGYSFQGLGNRYVGFGVNPHTSEADIILNADDNVLSLDADIYVWLLVPETFKPDGYYYTSLAAGFEFKKK